MEENRTDHMTEKEEKKKERNRREKKTGSMLESTFAKIAAFFVLVFGFAIGAAGIAGSIFLVNNDAYRQGVSQIIRNRMVQNVWEDVGNLKSCYLDGDTNRMEQYLENSNMQVELYQDGEFLWGNYKGMDTAYSFNCYVTAEMPAEENAESGVEIKVIGIEDDKESEDTEKAAAADKATGTDKAQNTEKAAVADKATGTDKVQNSGNAAPTDNAQGTDKGQSTYKLIVAEGTDAADEMQDAEEQPAETKFVELHYQIYIDDSFPVHDAYWQIYNEFIWLEDYLYLIPALAVFGILVTVCAFLFLMCGAGHHRGKAEITGGVLSNFHFDVVTLLFGAVAMFLLYVAKDIWTGDMVSMVVLIAIGAVEAVWCTIYCMELSVQLKMGTLLKNTLIYCLICWLFKILRAIGRGIVTMIREIPTVLSVAVIYGVLCIVDLIGMVIFFAWNRFWNFDVAMLVFWGLEKLVLFFIVFAVTLMFKRLLDGSKALAEGDLNYKVDTSKLILGLKEQGENLNRIGEGISLAVEERMKSERLKTELITNVSHDLKTPLTSIINYADLLGTQNADPEQVAEYTEVLLRQSKRLKTLLDDLLEASKATTGNLEVNLEHCEISVLLSQAVGEYEQRFEEKQLALIVRQPEESVVITADGRHLWRVFDNLLNNICKYAQENTRVYLTVEKDEREVRIIFRNMSQYPLELSAEELKERFVRGDKSRHMEGNGLGLSIAGSLTELQGGHMDITTDGDLFKVILKFPVS